MPVVWEVVVSDAARNDIRKIRRWSVRQFGAARGGDLLSLLQPSFSG